METGTRLTEPRPRCPYMTVSTLDDGRRLYCVYGGGMVFCHEQQWQAQWKLEALRCANGCSRQGLDVPQ